MSVIPIMDDDDAHFVDGHRTLLAKTDGEELIESICNTFGCNRQMAMEILAWADDHLGGRSKNDGQISAESLEYVRELQRFYRKVFATLIRYIAKQNNPQFIKMAVSAMALVCDFPDEAGAKTAAELARKFRVGKAFGAEGQGKQTVNKCIKLFCEQRLKIPPLAGQRSPEARANMQKKRLEQL